MASRREFLTRSGSLAAGMLTTTAALEATSNHPHFRATEEISLSGKWWFRTDPANKGTAEGWHISAELAEGWETAEVPHTWQVEPGLIDYGGVAWYRRSFQVPADWAHSAVRIEFEAVFHSAAVWVNGQLAGEHARKGYTAFTLEITHLLRWDEPNAIVVRVDNAFDEHMLPRGRSSDWAHDGGIYRPVQLLLTPKAFVERVDVEGLPDLASGDGKLTLTAYLKNIDSKPWIGQTRFRIVDRETGLSVLNRAEPKNISIETGGARTIVFQDTLPKAKLWHYDHPNLYELDFLLANEREGHEFSTRFGVRKLEVKEGQLRLNGEHVRLMGVERMAGSNPEFGMAEPGEWITHDHDDLKHLNCVFTRVHWPQDKRVLEYCDRHGILMQTEIPAWGPGTFKGMNSEPDADILENGVAQLREMIARDRNHPSLVIWGLCNEIDGQNPPAYQFAKHMLEEAKRLDPNRLCSYASHTLRHTPERDVAGLMDVIEANEYYGSWQPGSPESVAQNLDDIHAAFPGKPIVISEYGYCACTADRPEGDQHRIDILRTHDAVFRSRDFVGGAIFFCYNDYRTHVGDHGTGVMQQRIHGVVDLCGTQKPSYEVLRQESSPVESLSAQNQLNTFHVRLKTRRDVPSYILRGYKMRGIFYGEGNIPLERQEVALPDIAVGSENEIDLAFGQSTVPLYVKFDVLRPTDFSAYSLHWTP
jgi:beta-galactosidase